MKKLILNFLGAVALSSLLFVGGVKADEVRYQYDYNFPEGAFNLANFRASLRGLHQMDLMALQPRAKRIIDALEYGTDAAVQGEFAGTGCTVTANSSTVQVGSYSMQVAVDATGNREVERTLAINLSDFTSIKLWDRSTGTSDAIKFYVEDSNNDESYWDITTNGSANTWQQDTLTLASPDGNNGSNADLSDITDFGFQGLDASTNYLFDEIKAISGMNVSIKGTDLGTFYRHVYLGVQPLVIDAQASPTITAPSANPRIDILSIDSAGTLSWTTGTEAATPTVPWSSLPTDEIPICLVYNKTTETQILDYEDKDTDTNQGYIYADVRPFLNLSSSNMIKGSDVASTSSMTLGNDGNFFDITGTTGITSITAKPAGTVVWLQFDGALTVTDGSNLKLNGNLTTAAETTLQLVSDGTNWYEVSRSPIAQTFLAQNDTPSSYSGQALKVARVNSGESAIEFTAPTFLHGSDTPSTYSGQAGKYPIVNSGETGLEFTVDVITKFDLVDLIPTSSATNSQVKSVSEVTISGAPASTWRTLTGFSTTVTKADGFNDVPIYCKAGTFSQTGTDGGKIGWFLNDVWQFDSAGVMTGVEDGDVIKVMGWINPAGSLGSITVTNMEFYWGIASESRMSIQQDLDDELSF